MLKLGEAVRKPSEERFATPIDPRTQNLFGEISRISSSGSLSFSVLRKHHRIAKTAISPLSIYIAPRSYIPLQVYVAYGAKNRPDPIDPRCADMNRKKKKQEKEKNLTGTIAVSRNITFAPLT